MPTYFARGITTRLAVNSLANTITPSITLKKGDVAKRQAEEPERVLLQSELLPEQRVDFSGDDRGFDLNWLGGAPFIQVQVGDNLWARSSFSNRHEPLALSVHVKTSDMTFVSGLDKHNKLQLKIEVFFNGSLSSCLFLPPHEIRSNTKTHYQVFGGYRVDYLAERPWIILPPQTAADGLSRKTEGSHLMEKRWKDIGEALRGEADERGANKRGNTPPTSVFLKALATLDMPDQSFGLQRPGCKNFGVIDVVITAGEGRKVTSGTTYLMRPQRFTDENFSFPICSSYSEGVVGITKQSNVSTGTAKRNNEDSEGDSDSDYEPQPKRQALVPSTMYSKMLDLPMGSLQSDEQNKVSTMCVQENPIRTSTLVGPPALSEEALFPRSIGTDQLSQSSPAHNSNDHTDVVSNTRHDVTCQTPFGIPQNSFSFPSTSVDNANSPGMSPSPYNQSITTVLDDIVSPSSARKDDAVVLDHEWPIAQHLAIKEQPAGRQPVDEPTTSHRPGSVSRPLHSTEVLPSSQLAGDETRADVLPGRAPSLSHKSFRRHTSDEKQHNSGEGTFSFRFPGSRFPSDAVVERHADIVSAQSKNLQAPYPNPTEYAGNITHPLVPQRRAIPAASILGVQGPKAVTFLYDDPEDILREERKARRFQSSTKRDKKGSSTVNSIMPRGAKGTDLAHTLDPLQPPLSSSAVTREKGTESSNVIAPIVPFKPGKSNTNPEIEGSSLPNSNLGLPSNFTPHPPISKLISTPVRCSPKYKKRKTETGRYLPKQPRSPDRLKTIQNPPLNRDCVITFAESQGKECERGVLRQVKSERQGIFAEEYVVFASRFYVAGN